MRRLDKIEILCGQGGLNASKSPDLVRDIDLVAMASITMEQDTWQKDGGATKFNSVAVPPASGSGYTEMFGSLYHFITEGGVSELLCYNGEEVKVVGTGGVTKTVLSHADMQVGVRCPFVEGYNGTQKVVYHLNGLAASVGGGPWAYAGGTSASQLGTSVGTFTFDHTTDTLNRTSHGLTDNTLVFLTTTGTLPSGLSTLGFYFVVSAAANTFQIANSQGGSAITFTSNGTGTHTVHRGTASNDWLTSLSPRWGFMHRGRMYMGGGYYPHHIYASVLNNHSDFRNTGTLLFQVYPGEGELIVGGVSWRNKAYVFKYPKGVYVLDDSSNDTADWGWKRVSWYVGAVSQASIVEADDDVYFVSAFGYIHALSSVQESGDVKSSAVLPMELGPYILANADFSRIPAHASGSFYFYPSPEAVYYAEKRKLLFAFVRNPNTLSADSIPVNSLLVTLDIHRSDAKRGIHDVQASVSTRDKCESLARYRDTTTAREVILALSHNGFIYKLDQSARSKDSAGYMASFETKEFRPYDNDQNANMKELEVVFADGSSSNSVVIKVYLNGTLATTKTLTDSDRFMRLYGDCLKFKIVGENDTLNSSFSIAKIIVRFTRGNWRKFQ